MEDTTTVTDVNCECRCRHPDTVVPSSPSTVCWKRHRLTRDKVCVRTVCVTAVAFLLLSQLSLGTCERLTQSLATPVFQPTVDSVTRYHAQDNSKQYYRCLLLHSNKLYVGAMNHVIELNSANITNNPTVSVTLESSSSDKNDCERQSPSQTEYCENHVRAIIPRERGGRPVLDVCGTAAMVPTIFELDMNNIEASYPTPVRESGKAICPPDPDDTNTVLLVEQDGYKVTYSGALMDISKSDPAFYRPAIGNFSELLLTQRRDSKTLNDPKYVASFDAGDFVYFFFRENAIEYMNCGKEVYSRIARVCKNDKGGNRLALKKRWTTYFKARLNCSIPGDYPFYFNELHDVFRIDGTTDYYGLFTTNLDGLTRTAVCAFTDYAIQEVFNGSFKEQGDSNSNWQRVPDSRVPTPRPGLCSENSNELPEGVLQFTMARPLMDQAVEQDTGYPTFYKDDIVFQKMVVAMVTTDRNYRVFFLTTAEGSIHKVVTWEENDGRVEKQSKTVAVWENFTRDQQPIRQMILKEGTLYLSTDLEVLQLSVSLCSHYQYCTQCIQDPYCGWDITQANSRCVEYDRDNSNHIQSVTEEYPELHCSASCKHPTNSDTGRFEHQVRVLGDALHLHCESHCEHTDIVWKHNGTDVDVHSGKHFLTADNGLIIMKINYSDAGHYQCITSRGVVHTDHSLNISACANSEECWIQEFHKWCKEFDDYQKHFREWKCVKEKCLNSSEDTCVVSNFKDECTP